MKQLLGPQHQDPASKVLKLFFKFVKYWPLESLVATLRDSHNWVFPSDSSLPLLDLLSKQNGGKVWLTSNSVLVYSEKRQLLQMVIAHTFPIFSQWELNHLAWPEEDWGVDVINVYKYLNKRKPQLCSMIFNLAIRGLPSSNTWKKESDKLKISVFPSRDSN